MAGDPTPLRVGLIRIRDHCIFSWREGDPGNRRHVQVEPTHCRECLTEIGKLGYDLSRRDEPQK
jgi:hypothetical protein